jgi:hypothetical protein
MITLVKQCSPRLVLKGLLLMLATRKMAKTCRIREIGRLVSDAIEMEMAKELWLTIGSLKVCS